MDFLGSKYWQFKKTVGKYQRSLEARKQSSWYEKKNLEDLEVKYKKCKKYNPRILR